MDERTTTADLERRLAEAEAALRRCDERTAAAVESAQVTLNAFLVRFQEAVRGTLDPGSVAATACRLVTEELGVDRAYWSEVDWTTREFVIGADYTASGAEPISGRFPLDGWEPFSSYHLAGRPVVVSDTATDPRVTPDLLIGYQALGVQADLAVPVLAGEKLRSVLAVNQGNPREWSHDEITVVRRAADWCWAEVERARAEAAVRDSEVRQAFLLKLSDALRPIADAGEIQVTAAHLLGEHLGVDRAMYAEVTGEPGAETGVIRGQFIRTAAPDRPAPAPFPDHFTYESFGNDVMARRYSGEGLAVADVNADPEFDATDRAAWARVGVRAAIVAPLVKGHRLVAELGVHAETPRQWTGAEVSLVHEVGERTWAAAERARAEAALRANSEKYRSVFQAIDEGFCVWDVVQDASGRIVDLRFVEVNPAFERQTGLSHVVGRLVSDVAPGTEAEWISTYGKVASTGAAKRFEMHHADTGCWYDIYAARVNGPHGPRVSIVFRDITERRRTEEAERESKERQAFLLKLSDTLRTETGLDAVGNRAVRMVAEKLRADRVYLVTLNPDDDRVEVTHETRREGMPPLLGAYRSSDFPSAIREIFEHTIVYEDVRVDARLGDAERAAFAGLGAVGFIATSLRRGGEAMIWAAGALCTEPRSWTSVEVALFEEAVERIWAAVERARAEEALRESEARFRQFAQASSNVLWIRDARTLELEYISPAFQTVFGFAPAEVMGNLERGAVLVLPDDRDEVIGHLEAVRHGQPQTYEFRILRETDRAFRWIRDHCFPLFDDQGCIQRIGGIAEDVTEAKLAVEHSAVLLAELQHRVRNIMAMIRSITARTGERAQSVPDYAALMAGRLMTLARVQALLTRAANAGVGILGIVRDELHAQAQQEGQYTIEGPDLVLAPKAAEVLTLAVHELTTNALKYGGLSVPDGHVTVRWATFEKRGSTWLGFDWTEVGGPERAPPDPSTPRRRGFGSELIEARVPYELRGRGNVVIEPGGARCHLEFPLRNGDSILETDAPQRAAVFGGSIDMTGEADLSGHRVLVIEDDYYLATDTARALQGAGADVLGPCPDEQTARDELTDERPDVAVVDINLGSGPSFKLAETLKDRGIPFVFTTGYDPEVIPAEFDGVTRLQKPVQLRQIVAAVSKLLPAAV